MATTNLNTNSESIISSDLYEIFDFYDQLRAINVPDVNETAAIVGIFGYFEEIFSQTMQNTIITVAETTNETIPTRAKFSKNVISHALNLGINNINATPATMTMMIYLPISYLEQNFTELDSVSGRGKFILDKEIPIMVDGIEFHLDYDVIINRIRNADGKYVYTAMYDLFEPGTTIVKQLNPISQIYNPYITTIIQTKVSLINYVAFSARLHQVTYIPITQTILTSNSIENKTLTFDFDDQMAAFDVDVVENGKRTHLTPIYNGLLDYTVNDNNWCYYDYVSSNTIRIIFSRDAYMPKMNAEVTINIYLTEGASGNFTYNTVFRTSLTSEKYNNYGGMYALIYPLQNGMSAGGKDKKSVKDLKKIIPREASSRGAIINTNDLRNFFNSIDDSNASLFFKKKRDNPFERLYYAYMLMRKSGNVYPTNTINLKINQSDLHGYAGSNNLSITPGTIFYYYNHGVNSPNNFASVVPPQYYEPENEDITYKVTRNEDGDLVRVYEYISPFLITIDTDLISSYLLTIMNESKLFRFDSINTQSDLQFIATNMQWTRNYFYTTDDGEQVYDNKYTMTVSIAQNNSSEDYHLIKYHMNDNNEPIYDECRIKVYIVLYSDETNRTPYRYAEAELINYNEDSHTMDFRFTFETDDLMDLSNRINIKNVYNAKPEEFQKISTIPNSHGYMNKNTYAKLFILADFGTKIGDILDDETVVNAETQQIILYGDDGIGNRTEFEALIPTKDDIIDKFLKNEIYIDKNGQQVNVSYIMKSNPKYLSVVMQYNQDESQTTASILKYLRNNRYSDFVLNTLLADEDVIDVINSYNFEDVSRYTLCNVLSVEDGIDFYHDYSAIMRSDIIVSPVAYTNELGVQVYREVNRLDASGHPYVEYKPVYRTNADGAYYYIYTMKRIPVIKEGYLNSESLIQNFIYDLEERRRYIEECLYVLEDTFGIDFKFCNAFGPSNTFYYNIPTSNNYKSTVTVKKLNVYSSTVDEDDESAIVGKLNYGQTITIIKVNGQWGYIEEPYIGWVKLADTSKNNSFIDNVAVTLKFAMQLQPSADKYLAAAIVRDIKEYIEDINNINELHIPNIITLITNNYRDQLVYFEFLDVSNYGIQCQHLYLYETPADIADIVPEFINVELSEDGSYTPKIDITVFS